MHSLTPFAPTDAPTDQPSSLHFLPVQGKTTASRDRNCHMINNVLVKHTATSKIMLPLGLPAMCAVIRK